MRIRTHQYIHIWWGLMRTADVRKEPPIAEAAEGFPKWKHQIINCMFSLCCSPINFSLHYMRFYGLWRMADPCRRCHLCRIRRKQCRQRSRRCDWLICCVNRFQMFRNHRPNGPECTTQGHYRYSSICAYGSEVEKYQKRSCKLPECVLSVGKCFRKLLFPLSTSSVAWTLLLNNNSKTCNPRNTDGFIFVFWNSMIVRQSRQITIFIETFVIHSLKSVQKINEPIGMHRGDQDEI